MFAPEHFPESENGSFKSDRSVDLIRAYMRIFLGVNKDGWDTAKPTS